jgi:tellurite resistance protein TehA-like permease
MFASLSYAFRLHSHSCALVFIAQQAPFALAFLLQYSQKKSDVYNMLWALVFAFATMNILGLLARRLEPSRTRLSIGETVAIMVVIVSVLMLGWEMLYWFDVLPIKLHRHDG